MRRPESHTYVASSGTSCRLQVHRCHGPAFRRFHSFQTRPNLTWGRDAGVSSRPPTKSDTLRRNDRKLALSPRSPDTKRRETPEGSMPRPPATARNRRFGSTRDALSPLGNCRNDPWAWNGAPGPGPGPGRIGSDRHPTRQQLPRYHGPQDTCASRKEPDRPSKLLPPTLHHRTWYLPRVGPCSVLTDGGPRVRPRQHENAHHQGPPGINHKPTRAIRALDLARPVITQQAASKRAHLACPSNTSPPHYSRETRLTLDQPAAG